MNAAGASCCIPILIRFLDSRTRRLGVSPQLLYSKLSRGETFTRNVMYYIQYIVEKLALFIVRV